MMTKDSFNGGLNKWMEMKSYKLLLFSLKNDNKFSYIANKCWTVMVKHNGPVVPYISSVADTSLESVLREALILLELRFESFDVDGAG